VDRAIRAASAGIPPMEVQAVRWRSVTAVALFTGYAGLYLCRSNLSVSAPLIAADPTLEGVSIGTIGAIASAGVLAYALGKPVTGIAGDLLGGRRMFTAAMWATVAATVMFGAGGTAVLLGGAWVANRFVQSSAWGALAKLVAGWFAPERYGRIMAVLSLSFLFGDAAARLALGWLVHAGAGWRTVFAVSAATLSVVAVGVGLLLRERPSERGLPDPPSTGSASAYGADDRRALGVIGLVRPLLAAPTFLPLCVLSCGLTLVREAFNIWTPTFLVATYDMPAGDAARWSAVFPMVGGISVVLVGILGDRLGPGRRMWLTAPLVLCAGLVAIAAGADPIMRDVRLGLSALAVIALLLIGPYSLLAGAIAVELGGQRGAATAAGLIDTAGYLGAMLSGVTVAATSERFGWGWSLQLLGAVLVMASLVAVGVARLERRQVADIRSRRAVA
jgi:MFS transporter, OPA family, glycerol-3-phosphate transporter